jgi:hypothetical protein
MAHKAGCWDLRCNEAVLSAMLTHPRYRHATGLVDFAAAEVTRGNWAFAWYLPPDRARAALEPALDTIVRKQLRTGLWFKKHAEHHSYLILRALKHAGVPEGRLKHDPFAPFAERQDFYGLMVRRDIAGRVLPTDRELSASLVKEAEAQQQADGSWDHAVAATALSVERLLDLGADAERASVKRAGEWMLGQFQPTLERRRPGAARAITVRDTITADCGGGPMWHRRPRLCALSPSRGRLGHTSCARWCAWGSAMTRGSSAPARASRPWGRSRARRSRAGQYHTRAGARIR